MWRLRRAYTRHMTGPGPFTVRLVVTHLHDDDASHAMDEVPASALPHAAADPPGEHQTKTYQCADCGTRVSVRTTESDAARANDLHG